MRTKVLLCAAALAASLASSMADSNVYSLNVVGYYNISVAAHAKVMIANQLNTTNNTIGSLLTEPMIGDLDQVFKFDGTFHPSSYSTDDGYWSPSGATTLNPGEAVFFQPNAARTLTFVGEVLQGSLANTLPLGTKVMRASMVPQAAGIDVLGVVPDDLDQMYIYHGTYSPYSYSTDDGYWSPTTPIVAVGEGFFYKKDANGNPANANWVRNFTVQ